jgi:hypothetical protein
MPAVLKAASPEYRWRIRTRLPERYGQTCWVTARGALNSVRVEFPDGFWCITSRWSVRREFLKSQEKFQKVPAQGFEPWTIGLKDRCSAKLSYAGMASIQIRIRPETGPAGQRPQPRLQQKYSKTLTEPPGREPCPLRRPLPHAGTA